MKNLISSIILLMTFTGLTAQTYCLTYTTTEIASPLSVRLDYTLTATTAVDASIQILGIGSLSGEAVIGEQAMGSVTFIRSSAAPYSFTISDAFPFGVITQNTFNGMPAGSKVSASCSVLPVELVNFSGYTEGGKNYLTWTTANEINNKGFEVDRKQATGDSWETLSLVSAKGKSSIYNFTDDYRLPPVAYYRLRQIDNDGKETVSKIIALSNSSKNRLKIYPSVTNSFLTIETDLTGDYQVVNLLGQTVLIGKTLPSGVEELDVSALPQGAYLLKVGAEQVKFVKQ